MGRALTRWQGSRGEAVRDGFPGGKRYRRHMQAVGAPGFLEPIKLPPWGGR